MGKKFKDIFVKNTDAEQPQMLAEKQMQPSAFVGDMPASINMQQTSENSGQNAVYLQQGMQVKPSEELVTKLWAHLVKMNLPGPDYLELKDLARPLEAFMPSYEQRLLAAFGILKSQYNQFDTKVVVDAIDKYIGFIKDEEKEGEAECERVYGAKLTSSETALEQITNDIASMQEEIRKKNEELNSLIAQKATLQEDVIKAKAEKEYQANIFASSVKVVLNTLESDKQTISNLKI